MSRPETEEIVVMHPLLFSKYGSAVFTMSTTASMSTSKAVVQLATSLSMDSEETFETKTSMLEPTPVIQSLRCEELEMSRAEPWTVVECCVASVVSSFSAALTSGRLRAQK